MKYYSKSTNGFYDSAIHKTIPDDAKQITKTVYQNLLELQSAGNQIISDNDGTPVSHPPAPTLYHKWSGSAWIIDTDKKQEVIAALEKKIDAETDETILTGFHYDGNYFYLSLENQMNFKGQNDIRESLTYPVKIKHQNGYAYIANAVEYHSFFLAGLGFKQLTIEAGWDAKDALQNKTTAELIELL